MARKLFIALFVIILFFGCTSIAKQNYETTETNKSDLNSVKGSQNTVNPNEPYYPPKDNAPNGNNWQAYDQNNSQQWNNDYNYNKFPDCGNTSIFFDHSLTDMSKVVTLTPLGVVSPPDHVFPPPHLYIYLVDFKNPKPSTAPVYAPGNMTLTQIGLRHYNKFGKKTDYIDYTLMFTVCKDFKLYFHHITTIGDQFKEATDKILEKCSFSQDRNEDFCQGEVNIPITSGTQIGTAGDIDAGIYGFDLGARDYRIQNGKNFSNPDRFCPEGERNFYERCYTVCPFDYFTENVRSSIKFSNQRADGSITSGLGCGTVYEDISGTIQGTWFYSGTEVEEFSPESDNLYIGPDQTVSEGYEFSIGTHITGIKAGKYNFVVGNSNLVNVNPSKTKSGNVYCYDLLSEGYKQGSIILELTDSSTLKIEYKPGECGNDSWVLSGSATTFVR